MNIQEEPQFSERSKRKHLWYALASGMIIGITNFIYSMLIAQDSSIHHGKFNYEIIIPTFIGRAIVITIYYIRTAYQNKQKYGLYWMRELSPYLSSTDLQMIKTDKQASIEDTSEKEVDVPEETKNQNEKTQKLKPNCFNIIGVSAIGILNLTNLFLHICLLYLAQKSHINFSILLNIYALSGFMTLVAFRLIFKEQIHLKQTLGMCFLLIFMVMVAREKIKKDAEMHDQMGSENHLSLIFPLGLAIILSILFTVVNILRRFVSQKGKLTSYQLLADGYFIQVIILFSLYLVLPWTLPKSTLYIAGCLSVMGTISNFLSNDAIINGPAGPCQALSDTHTVWSLILEIVCQTQIPTLTELIAFIISMIGIFLIAMGKDK